MIDWALHCHCIAYYENWLSHHWMSCHTKWNASTANDALSHAMNLWALLQLWCGACACLWHRIGCCDRSTSISETLCESRIKSVVQLWCPIQFRPKQAHTVIDATRCCDMPACVAMPCICDMPTCMRYWQQMSLRSDVVKCKMPTCVIDWRSSHWHELPV